MRLVYHGQQLPYAELGCHDELPEMWRRSPCVSSGFASAWQGGRCLAFQEYLFHGGMPLVLNVPSGQGRGKYLKGLFEKTFLTDIMERHDVRHTEDLGNGSSLRRQGPLSTRPISQRNSRRRVSPEFPGTPLPSMSGIWKMHSCSRRRSVLTSGEKTTCRDSGNTPSLVSDSGTPA